MTYVNRCGWKKGGKVRSLNSRVEVVVPAFALGAALSALVALGAAIKLSWGLESFAIVWSSMLAGPFSVLWFGHDELINEAVLWGAVFGVAMAAHPLRPGWSMGVVSIIGVFGWVFLGFAYTFDGV